MNKIMPYPWQDAEYDREFDSAAERIGFCLVRQEESQKAQLPRVSNAWGTEVNKYACDLLEENEQLRAEGKDFRAFVNWIVPEIDDEDQMIRIVKRAKDNPMGMNDDCTRSVDLFLSYVAEDLGCDHSVGVCACALRKALGEHDRDWVEESLLGSDIE